MKKDADSLRSQIVIHYLQRRTGMGTGKLSLEIFGDTKEHRKKVQLWKSGTRMHATNRNAILNRFPESDILLNSAIYKLLEPKLLTHEKIDELLAGYRRHKGSIPLEYWCIPDMSWQGLAQKDKSEPIFPILGRFNSKALSECGAADGFIIILGLLHEINADITQANDDKRHYTARLTPHLIEAARAFPVFARHPDVKPYWEKLYTLFKKLWYYFNPSFDALILDDQLMSEYVNMHAEYYLARGVLGRVPGSYRLKLFRAPVLQATEWDHATS